MGCREHSEHFHQHGTGCGHRAIQYNDHTDYLHDRHMHTCTMTTSTSTSSR
jgi:hypothetical protein